MVIKVLYYFYDRVSYADGNKPFGIEEYNQMIEDSSLFDFQILNYDKTYYDKENGFFDDCDINKGGYYCQVYDNEDMDNEIDNFVIQAEDVAAGLTDKMVEDYLNSKW
jgi:hypothetical protein